MNNCILCGHELVNIIYGMPGPTLIEMARAEGIALGGCSIVLDMPTHYCYGCNEAFPAVDNLGADEEVDQDTLFSN